MIVNLNEIRNKDEVFEYCYQENLKPESRVYFFEEKRGKYFQLLEEAIKDEIFLIAIEDATITGAILVESAGEDNLYSIKGLWGEKRVKQELLEELISHCDSDKGFYIIIEKSNEEVLQIIEARDFHFWEEATVLRLDQPIAMNSNSIEIIRIHANNFHLAKVYADRYFSDYYWNADRLFRHIEERDLVLFQQNGQPIGIAQGVIRNGEAEIFGLVSFDEEDRLALTTIYSNYLLEEANNVLYFLEDVTETTIQELLGQGFTLESSTVTYKLDPK